jgi:hypothetical protein
MRAFATLVVGVLVSVIVSRVFQLVVARFLDAPEERRVAFAVEIVVAVLVALIFGIVLTLRGGRRAIAVAAVTLVVLGVAGLAAVEAFSLADEAAALNPSDLPLMIELGVPGLVTVFIQWWLVSAHLRRQTARATLVPAEG